MSLLSDSTHLPSTRFDMMKPVLSAKDTDTTPTMAVKDKDDDTSSLQDPMDTNVVETKTSSISKMPMVSMTDDDTGATVSTDEDETVVWKKIKLPSGDPPPSPPPPCTSPPPPLDNTHPFRVLRLRG